MLYKHTHTQTHTHTHTVFQQLSGGMIELALASQVKGNAKQTGQKKRASHPWTRSTGTWASANSAQAATTTKPICDPDSPWNRVRKIVTVWQVGKFPESTSCQDFLRGFKWCDGITHTNHHSSQNKQKDTFTSVIMTMTTDATIFSPNTHTVATGSKDRNKVI